MIIHDYSWLFMIIHDFSWLLKMSEVRKEGRKEKCNIYTTSPKGWLVPSNIGGGGMGVVRIIRWLFMIIGWLFMIINDVKMVGSKNRWRQRSLFLALESVSEVEDAKKKFFDTPLFSCTPIFHFHKTSLLPAAYWCRQCPLSIVQYTQCWWNEIKSYFSWLFN